MTQLIVAATVIGTLVLTAALAFIYPAARTIDALLNQERELERSLAELNQARDRYQASEQRFRDIADAASDWFWETGPDLRFTYFSPRSEELVGVPVWFHIGKTRAELAGEDVNTEKWRRHLKALEDREPFRDFRFIRKGHDGRLQYLSTSGKPKFDDDGNFLGYIGVGTDLTAQEEARQQARLASDRLASAVESMSEVFALWDPDDRLVICNEQFRRLNAPIADAAKPGTSYEEHVRAATAAGLIPEALDNPQAWIEARLRRHADPGAPFELQRQGGRWLYIHEQKLPDGSTITISSDITQMKRHAADLAASEQRFADFAETAAGWFWEQDEDLRFTYISAPNLEDIGLSDTLGIGLTREETNPRGISAEQMQAHNAALSAREPFNDFRFFRLKADGSRIYVSVSGKPVFDANGVFKGYRGVGRDVTELTRAEQRVRAERDRAESANLAKSDFLARMSHELRTPMNAILGFSQIIEGEVFGPVGAERYREYAGDIHRSGEHLLSLINDLLDLSKIEAGKFELRDELLDVGAVIDDVRRLFIGTAAAAGLRLELRVAPALPGLFADRRAVRQMITNLISNAIKFTESGGRVSIRATCDDDGLVVTVADTGVGFHPNHLELVLSPFGRIDKPMVRTVDGTGLGLPIVKNLIDLHDGTFDLLSAPGEGTQAILRFPSARLRKDVVF